MSSAIETTKDKGRPLLSPGFSCLGSAPLGKGPLAGDMACFLPCFPVRGSPVSGLEDSRAVGGKRGSLPSLMRQKLQADALSGPLLVPRPPRDQTHVSCVGSWVLYPWPIWKIYGPLQIRLNDSETTVPLKTLTGKRHAGELLEGLQVADLTTPPVHTRACTPGSLRSLWL